MRILERGGQSEQGSLRGAPIETIDLYLAIIYGPRTK